VKKWEASRGLDPRSYGYNRATPDNLYMTADQVVDTLADINSKNGNFLLDIGPAPTGQSPRSCKPASAKRDPGSRSTENPSTAQHTGPEWHSKDHCGSR